jgi:phage/plasmid primase-like uncharacterized protein
MMGNLSDIFGVDGFDALKHLPPEVDLHPEFAFADALASFGMVLEGSIPQGKIQRCRMADQKNGNKRNGWYLYFGLDHSTNISAGVFGDWRYDDRHYWSSKPEREMDVREHALYKAHIKKMQAQVEEEKRIRQAEAAEEAQEIIAKSQPAVGHAYLTRKQVKPYGLYADGETLIIPMRDADGHVKSLQRIFPSGDKRFLAGGQTRGCFHLIGAGFTDPTYIAEGYATGATIHALTKKSVVVAFTSGNLAPALEAIKSHIGQSKVIIAADNDRHTEGNPGIAAAKKAADIIPGTTVLHPEFAGDEGTDFNDLVALEGVAATAAILCKHLGQEKAGKRLLVPLSELRASAPSWIIKGVIPTEAIGVLFGPSSGGKSFAALDMALSIASGRDWHGRKTKRQGGVIYVCGEGQQGIANRVRAWEKHTGIAIADLPMRVTTAPVRFLDPSAKAELMEAVQAEMDALGTVVLIIIDTLNRNFGDGDENSTKDMTNFIDAVTDVHKDSGATVLIVHHTGLSDGDRARGNGSLKNACDFEIKHSMVSKEGDPDKIFALVGKKMKDGSEMPPTQFRLVVVPLGLDEDGEDYASCVVELVPGDVAEGAALADSLTRGMGANQLRMMESLADYRQMVLTNLPDKDPVIIDRQNLIELMKNIGCPPNKTADWITRAIRKGFLKNLNPTTFEVTKNVTIG